MNISIFGHCLRTLFLLSFCSVVIVTTLHAGGPLSANGTTPIKYAASSFPLVYQIDRGSLGAFTNTEAVGMVDIAFRTWGDLSTAILSFRNNGWLNNDVTSSNDPYISGPGQFADGIIPVVFDTDGSITDDRIGFNAKQQVYGFATSVSENGVNFVDGFVIVNGFLSGNGNESLRQQYLGVITHELGHMLGVSHSQVGMHADFSLMYPTTLISSDESIRPDDAAAVSMLYPAPGYLASVGTVSGTVKDINGAPISGVNVVAVDSVTGDTYSSVVDYFSGVQPTFPNPVPSTGAFVISGLPPGRYFVRIEPINPLYTQGSSIASYRVPINTDVFREWYNAGTESGDAHSDNVNEKTSVVVQAGTTTGGVDFVVNQAGTLTTLSHSKSEVGVFLPLPFPVGGATITKYAMRFTAPQSGSLLGMKLFLSSVSDMPRGGFLTVAVHANSPGSLAGIPGQELGSVTIPFSCLAADQDNEVWLRHLGSAVNFLGGQDFHIVVTTNGIGRLTLLGDDGFPTENRSSYSIGTSGNWANFPQGLGNTAGYNLFMSAVYTSVPAGLPVPFANVTPSQVDFGGARIGVLTEKSVTLANLGAAPLEVSNVSIIGADASEFSIVNGGGIFQIESGQSRTITFGFAPGSSGNKSANLIITSNAPQSPSTVSITGRGTAPVATQLETELDFGERNIGGSFIANEAIIRNSGNDTLTIDNLVLSGPDASVFTIVGGKGPIGVAPLLTYRARLQFEPQEVREYMATLSMTHDAEGEVLEVAITGTGVDPTSGVEPHRVTAAGVVMELLPVVPNPARDEVEIVYEVSGAGAIPVSLVVTDLQGKNVAVLSVDEVETGGRLGLYRHHLNLAGMPSGEYQVVLSSEHGTAVTKFIVVR